MSSSIARAILGPDPMVEFLLARIAEEEEGARAALGDGGAWSSRYPHMPDCHMYGEYGWYVSGPPGVETDDSEWGRAVVDHIARWDPERVLADCKARRSIINGLAMALDKASEKPSMARVAAMESMLLVGKFLAQPYASHPDFKPEWRA